MSNPYSPPAASTVFNAPSSGSNLSPSDLQKAEAVIKDASQYWLAIFLCAFCSGLGGVLIGPWYFIRFMQWKRLARENPQLVQQPVPQGSLPQRFQKAKVKLLIGLGFGCFMLMIVIAAAAVLFASVSRMDNGSG